MRALVSIAIFIVILLSLLGMIWTVGAKPVVLALLFVGFGGMFLLWHVFRRTSLWATVQRDLYQGHAAEVLTLAARHRPSPIWSVYCAIAHDECKQPREALAQLQHRLPKASQPLGHLARTLAAALTAETQQNDVEGQRMLDAAAQAFRGNHTAPEAAMAAYYEARVWLCGNAATHARGIERLQHLRQAAHTPSNIRHHIAARSA